MGGGGRLCLNKGRTKTDFIGPDMRKRGNVKRTAKGGKRHLENGEKEGGKITNEARRDVCRIAYRGNYAC